MNLEENMKAEKFLKTVLLVMILAFANLLMAFTDTQVDSLLNRNVDKQLQQATDLYGKGQYEDALLLYIQYWQNNYDDNNTLYNIACLYGLLNKGEMAGKFLQEAFNKGFSDIDHAKNDKDFDLVKNDPVFIKYWTKLQEDTNKLNRIHGEISYIKADVKIRYRTVLPDNYDPKKSYKILIGLHGFSGNHYRFAEFSRFLKNNDIIFVTPQAPYPMEFTMGKTTSFSWTVSDVEELPGKDHSGDLSAQYILSLNKELRKKYNPEGIYLSGFSQGGFMTLAIGLINYKEFDGLISFGGGLTDGWVNDKVIKKAKSIPVLIVHGINDKAVDYKKATMANEVLKKAGYDVTHLSDM